MLLVIPLCILMYLDGRTFYNLFLFIFVKKGASFTFFHFFTFIFSEFQKGYFCNF